MKNILSKTLLLALVGCAASAMDQQNVKTVNHEVSAIVDRMVDRVVAQDFRQKVQGFIKKIKAPIVDQLFSVHLIMMADRRACDSGDVTHAALIAQKQNVSECFAKIAHEISQVLEGMRSDDSVEQAGKKIVADAMERLVDVIFIFTMHDNGVDRVVQIYKELEELLRDVSANLSIDHALVRAIPAEIARQEQERIAQQAAHEAQIAQQERERIAQQEAHEAQLARQEQFRKKYEKIYYAQLPDEQLEEVRNIARDQRSANEAAMQEVARIEQERIAQEAHDALVAQQERERIAQQEAEAARLKQERIVQQKAHEALVAQQKKERIAQQEAEAARLEQERIAQQVAKALAAQQERERIAQQKAHQVQRERELIEIASQEHEKAMKKQEDKIAAKAALAQQKEQELQRAQEAAQAQQKAAQEADEKEREAARLKRETAASSVDDAASLKRFLDESQALTHTGFLLDDAIIKSRLELAQKAIKDIKLFESFRQGPNKELLSAMNIAYDDMMAISKRMRRNQQPEEKARDRASLDKKFIALANDSNQFLEIMCGQVRRHLGIDEPSVQTTKIDDLKNLREGLVRMRGTIKNRQLFEQLCNHFTLTIRHFPDQVRQWIEKNYLTYMREWLHGIYQHNDPDQVVASQKSQEMIDEFIDGLCCFVDLMLAGLSRGFSDEVIDRTMQEAIKDILSKRNEHKVADNAPEAGAQPSSPQSAKIKDLQNLKNGLLRMRSNIKDIQSLQEFNDYIAQILNYCSAGVRQWIETNYLLNFQGRVHEIVQMNEMDQGVALAKYKDSLDLTIDRLYYFVGLMFESALEDDSDESIDLMLQEAIKDICSRVNKHNIADKAQASASDASDVRVVSLREIIRDSRTVFSDGAPAIVLAQRTLMLTERLMPLLQDDSNKHLIRQVVANIDSILIHLQAAQDTMHSGAAQLKPAASAIGSTFASSQQHVGQLNLKLTIAVQKLNGDIERSANGELRASRKMSSGRQEQIAGLKKIMGNLLSHLKCCDIASLRKLREHGQSVADLLQGSSKELFLMHCLNLVDSRINAAPTPLSAVALAKEDGNADEKDIKNCAQRFINEANSIVNCMYREMNKGASDEEIATGVETIVNGLIAAPAVAQSSASSSLANFTADTSSSGLVVHEEKQREEKTQVEHASAAPGDPDIQMASLQDIIRDLGTICNDGADPVTMAQQMESLTQRLIPLLQDADKLVMRQSIDSIKMIRSRLRAVEARTANNPTIINTRTLNMRLATAVLHFNKVVTKQAERQLRALRAVSSGCQEQIKGLKGIMGKLLPYYDKCFDISGLKELRQHGQLVADLLQGRSKEWFIAQCIGKLDGRINVASVPGHADKEDIKKIANLFIDRANYILGLIYGLMNKGVSDEEIAAFVEQKINGLTAAVSAEESSASASASAASK